MSLEQFKEHFCSYGEVIYASFFIDRETGRSKGAGKIEFASQDSARRCIEEMNGSELQGRPITVKVLESGPPGDRPERIAERTARPANGDGRTVFVGNLSWNLSTDALRDHFTSCGEVIFATIFTDRETGKPRGSGKVQFASSQEAQRAIQKLHESELVGRQISVRLMGEARPQRETVNAPPGPRGGDSADANCMVFVGGLSWDTDNDRLREYFEQAGEIQMVQVFTDRETGKSKGAGKVQFTTAEIAQQACENFNGTELDGRTLTVKIMEIRERGWRPPERTAPEVERPKASLRIGGDEAEHEVPEHSRHQEAWPQQNGEAVGSGPYCEPPTNLATGFDDDAIGDSLRMAPFGGHGFGADGVTDPMTDCPTDF